ncbi:IS3 family transposase [Porphyrobacter algicida]|uniref:IS3 family transposase n=1 Tax=Qipengyuania algicida TaxID=1836209 RepID=A0A845AIM3_9SPHN|nr:IS3 family transposase [Qipengyuania algicida]MXP29454.1 IS3 family transposase [Qipengyuania algicida]
MSRHGICRGDAVVETFFSSPEHETIRRRISNTCEEARQGVFDYIEMFCNLIHNHARNGLLSPVEFEP